MLIGEYHHSLDAKNRIAVPAKLRADLGSIIYIIAEMDGCLTLYSKENFEEKLAAQKAMNRNQMNVRKMKRTNARASEATYDAQGRIVIPDFLCSRADLQKSGTCVFVGCGDYVELWDEDKWNRYEEEELTDEQIAEISESL